jgi:hypothetical protein
MIPSGVKMFLASLQRIAAGWPSSDIDALMPWSFQK